MNAPAPGRAGPALDSLPYAWARAHRACVARDEGGALVHVCPQTPGWAVVELRRRYPAAAFRRVGAAAMDDLIASAYAHAGDAASVMGAAENNIDLDRLMQDMPELTDLLDATDDAPVIRMINALLSQAAGDGASDIHFDVFETRASVRYRVDGQFRDVVAPRKALHAALISRIKIMAQMDIAEKRLPQDGRIGLRVGGKAIDVRVSTVPTAHGERAVLRLLLKDAGRLQLASLGMAPELRDGLTRLIRQPHGIVLVTGPTGSGKTTTMYSALGQLDPGTNNIMTVEDPIEYDLPGIAQIPVNARIGMTFAVALRAVLRQDPDNILIGETRDLETAQIAIQSSLTGHGVLTSVHTNNAVSAVTRVVDMGVEPFLLASTLLGVLAQRLVRCLCPDCKQADEMPDGRLAYRAVGCAACAHSGYRGRTGVHELLVVDNGLRRLIHQRADEQALLAAAIEGGMRTMRDDGQRWVDAGITTQEEILRVTRDA
ncbi:type II secretion system ATPase GspE [Pollutimonas bauzanensis]|uniref:Type II secretion system protein E n=1 Tax=Pollutimonas bauzanensis TaxID=658167 RepID=A0A1M6BDW3_9BURK|nr:type II secretion system ATPase GspE [Pollutimonas bauzanensis]SHI46932.1 general secretion pathway protein E [Pollutimonas bauzanensis]